MTERDVVKEMLAIIDVQLAEAREPGERWLVQEQVSRHPLPDSFVGDDRDFYTLGAALLSSRAAKLALRRRGAPDETDADAQQLRLPGYEYLQRAYLIEREGEQRLVLIERMTDAELFAKADEKRRLAKGNDQHAEEILTYIEWRRGHGLREA